MCSRRWEAGATPGAVLKKVYVRCIIVSNDTNRSSRFAVALVTQSAAGHRPALLRPDQPPVALPINERQHLGDQRIVAVLRPRLLLPAGEHALIAKQHPKRGVQ